jgi:hypothetical protein
MACKGNCNQGDRACKHVHLCNQPDDFYVDDEWKDWLVLSIAFLCAIILASVYFHP